MDHTTHTTLQGDFFAQEYIKDIFLYQFTVFFNSHVVMNKEVEDQRNERTLVLRKG